MSTPVEALLRRCAPEVLGVLVRRHGDFAAAEDALQEALITAAEHWPRTGVPDNPQGWLVRTAGRRFLDAARSDTARRRREDSAATEPAVGPAAGSDDTLRLLFLCCHPELTPASAIAITLRAVGGLSTAEIAAAFLVPEATMAQRITRAKARIAAAPTFSMPGANDRAQRVQSVLRVLYLMFNEGYTSSGGDRLQRVDLAHEAIRLTRTAHAALPEDPEVAGLLALMLLTDARRPARTTADGELVPLAEQNRALWTRPAIAEGVALVVRAMSRGVVGEYQLQAAIAAVHDSAPTAADTDWPEILRLYDLLTRLRDDAVVALNRVVAVARVHGPQAALDTLDALDVPGELAGSHRAHAVRAHLLAELGDAAGAAEHFGVAARRTTNAAEQRHLIRLAARQATPPSP